MINNAELDLSWAAMNSGLIDRMAIKMEKTASVAPSTTTTEDYKEFNDKNRLEKLFECNRDTKAMQDIDVKHFLINTVLNEFRQNKAEARLTNQTIDQFIRYFGYDSFENVPAHRKEIWNLVMELLELKLPLTALKRWDWICIITSRHSPSYEDSELLQTLDIFSNETYRFMNEERRPYEFKLFLLTLLEYDYAAMLARRRQADNGGDELPKKSLRGVPVENIEHLDNYPLAYLLLCKFTREIHSFQERSNVDSLVLNILMQFNPKVGPMNMTSVYARLTGLLLDVLLYVERKGNSSVRNVETDITPKVHELVKKIRINHDGGKPGGMEWRTFLDMCNVPWIRVAGPMWSVDPAGLGRMNGLSEPAGTQQQNRCHWMGLKALTKQQRCGICPLSAVQLAVSILLPVRFSLRRSRSKGLNAFNPSPSAHLKC